MSTYLGDPTHGIMPFSEVSVGQVMSYVSDKTSYASGVSTTTSTTIYRPQRIDWITPSITPEWTEYPQVFPPPPISVTPEWVEYPSQPFEYPPSVYPPSVYPPSVAPYPPSVAPAPGKIEPDIEEPEHKKRKFRLD